MDYQDLIEERLYANLLSRDMVNGTIIGTVPPIFLGLFSPLYGVAELIAYVVTGKKIWLYAAIASFIVSIGIYLVHYSSEYNNFLNKEASIIPIKFSK